RRLRTALHLRARLPAALGVRPRGPLRGGASRGERLQRLSRPLPRARWRLAVVRGGARPRRRGCVRAQASSPLRARAIMIGPTMRFLFRPVVAPAPLLLAACGSSPDCTGGACGGGTTTGSGGAGGGCPPVSLVNLQQPPILGQGNGVPLAIVSD